MPDSAAARRGGAGVVHIHYAGLDCAAHAHAAWWALLSADERERAAQFHTETDARRYIAGRGLLRTLLARYTGGDPAALRFGYGARGKPALRGRDAALHFNLAHAGGRLVIAVTSVGAVGVDIEALAGGGELEPLARRILTPRERARWLALPPRRRRTELLRRWTRKEAYLKALGCGLALRPNELDVCDVRPRGAADVWRLYDLDAGAAHVAALAVAGEVGRIRIAADVA